MQSNVLKIVEGLVTRIHNAVTTREMTRIQYKIIICEQQEVNNDEKFNYSWPTDQENESEEQPERNDKEEFGNSWGVDEKNEIDEQQ